MKRTTKRLPLSNQIDRALFLEEYHRDRMLLWKRRRQQLEQQIPLTNDVVSEAEKIAMEAWENESDQA